MCDLINTLIQTGIEIDEAERRILSAEERLKHLKRKYDSLEGQVVASASTGKSAHVSDEYVVVVTRTPSKSTVEIIERAD